VERENTRHPRKNELFLNVGVWLTKNEADSAKARGRIEQYGGISSIDNKDGGPEIAVIFRDGKAYAFKRVGGLYEGGRWKPGKKSSTYEAKGEIADATAFRQLIIETLKAKTEQEAGFTNAQAEKGEYTTANATSPQSDSGTKEKVAGTEDAKPMPKVSLDMPGTQKDMDNTPGYSYFNSQGKFFRSDANKLVPSKDGGAIYRVLNGDSTATLVQKKDGKIIETSNANASVLYKK